VRHLVSHRLVGHDGGLWKIGSDAIVVVHPGTQVEGGQRGRFERHLQQVLAGTNGLEGQQHPPAPGRESRPAQHGRSRRAVEGHHQARALCASDAHDQLVLEEERLARRQVEGMDLSLPLERDSHGQRPERLVHELVSRNRQHEGGAEQDANGCLTGHDGRA